MQASSIEVQPFRPQQKQYFGARTSLVKVISEIRQQKGALANLVQVLQNHNVEVCRVYQKEL